MANYKKYMIKFGNGTYHYGGNTAIGGTPNIESGHQYRNVPVAKRVFNSIMKHAGPESHRYKAYTSEQKNYHEVIEPMRIVEVTFTTTEVEI